MAKSDIANFLKEIQSVNPFAEILENETLSEIKDYISTGSLILNAIISGNCFKGVPAGRVTTFSGLSGVGKTLLAATTVAEAQKKGYVAVWFDSEFASDKETLTRLGVDPKRCIKLPVASIEEFKNQAFKILGAFEARIEKGEKLIMVLDSLGNLASQKEIDDITEGKNAADMGLKAKIIRSIFRLLIDRIGKLAVPLIVINHTYANPGNPYAGETMGGGEGIKYISHIVVNLKNSKVKDSTNEIIGTVLKPTTVKNRLVPPFKTGEILLNFDTGMDKYYGLLDIAIELGIVIKEGKRYKTIKDDTLRWEKNMYTDGVWEPIIDIVNEAFSSTNQYSSINLSNEEIEMIEGTNKKNG